MIKALVKKFCWVFALLLFVNCNDANRWEADTSATKIAVTYGNWNDDLASKNPEIFLKTIKQDTRELYKYYLGAMLEVDPANDSLCVLTLNQFMGFPSTIEGLKQIKIVFPDIEKYKTEITAAFLRIKYFYPTTKNQKIITYHSGFNFGVFPVDGEIGIGLEMYLGEKNKAIDALPVDRFPKYIKKNMDPKNLVVDVIRGYTIVNLIPENTERDFISAIVYEGKVLLALDAFLPNKADHEKIRFEKDKLEWCRNYEKEIWKEIVEQKWLYSTDLKVISQFVNEAPFTSTLPQNSPPRVGAWLGWQMLRAYAKDYPELNLHDILQEKDATKILRSYKPNK